MDRHKQTSVIETNVRLDRYKSTEAKTSIVIWTSKSPVLENMVKT